MKIFLKLGNHFFMQAVISGPYYEWVLSFRVYGVASHSTFADNLLTYTCGVVINNINKQINPIKLITCRMEQIPLQIRLKSSHLRFFTSSTFVIWTDRVDWLYNIREFGVYTVRDFSVIGYKGRFNPCSHPCQILFLFKMRIQECEHPIIPFYGLNFTEFNIIESPGILRSQTLGIQHESW